MSLNALEIVKRLEAGLAPIVCLARRRAKLAHSLGFSASATRAADRGSSEQVAGVGNGLRRRRDPKGLELLPATLRQPFTCPRWRKHLLQHGIAISRGVERFSNRPSNHIGSRATRISGREANTQSPVSSPIHVPSSTMLRTGISGSITSSSTRQTARSLTSPAFTLCCVLTDMSWLPPCANLCSAARDERAERNYVR
jgi:hypothetical protein